MARPKLGAFFLIPAPGVTMLKHLIFALVAALIVDRVRISWFKLMIWLGIGFLMLTLMAAQCTRTRADDIVNELTIERQWDASIEPYVL